MLKIAIITLIVIAIAILVGIALAPNGKPIGKFKRRKLMTENETEFFGRLVDALPEYFIFPQVSMQALIEASSWDKTQAHQDRLRIAQQRVDYVVCDRQCDVVVVVELDDRTHSKQKDHQRDARLLQGDITTIRFQTNNKPNAEMIRAIVLAAKENRHRVEQERVASPTAAGK